MENSLKKIIKKLKSEKGMSGTLGALIGIVIFCICIYAIIIIINIYSSAKSTKDSIEQSAVSTIQQNYKNTYHASRESYSVGYVPTESDFSKTVLLSMEDIRNILSTTLGLEANANGYARVDSNKNKIFSIDNINVDVNNEEIKSDTIKFVANIRYDFIYYINFIGYQTNIKIPININSKYTNKF